MRPFRFFFGISLAIIVFFFVARFVLVAFVFAAILSTLFFIGKRLKYFFQNMRWRDEYDHPYRGLYLPETRRPLHAFENQNYFNFPNRQNQYASSVHTIELK